MVYSAHLVEVILKMHVEDFLVVQSCVLQPLPQDTKSFKGKRDPFALAYMEMSSQAVFIV